jgi:hypothetical protein
MVLPNHKKISSITISQKLLNQMNSMIDAEIFSSMSDIVNTATIFVLGEISTERANPNFDYSMIIENMPIDKSEKRKISVALSGYLDTEIEKLSKITKQNKSFIVRMALFRFFDVQKNNEEVEKLPIIEDEKAFVSKNELEAMIQEIVNRTLNEK